MQGVKSLPLLTVSSKFEDSLGENKGEWPFTAKRLFRNWESLFCFWYFLGETLRFWWTDGDSFSIVIIRGEGTFLPRNRGPSAASNERREHGHHRSDSRLRGAGPPRTMRSHRGGTSASNPLGPSAKSTGLYLGGGWWFPAQERILHLKDTSRCMRDTRARSRRRPNGFPLLRNRIRGRRLASTMKGRTSMIRDGP